MALGPSPHLRNQTVARFARSLSLARETKTDSYTPQRFRQVENQLTLGLYFSRCRAW